MSGRTSVCIEQCFRNRSDEGAGILAGAFAPEVLDDICSLPNVAAASGCYHMAEVGGPYDL